MFSTTLSALEGNARLATGSLVEEIGRLRAESAGGDIAIGGAALAAEAARLDLELVESRTFGSGIVQFRDRTSDPSRP